MYVLPFDCVFSWNNNPNTVKLSTHTLTLHQYTILLTKGMSLTKYWCTSNKLYDSFICTMSIYNHQYPLLFGYTSILHGWISTTNNFFHCVLLDQTWAKHRKINSYPRFPLLHDIQKKIINKNLNKYILKIYINACIETLDFGFFGDVLVINIIFCYWLITRHSKHLVALVWHPSFCVSFWVWHLGFLMYLIHYYFLVSGRYLLLSKNVMVWFTIFY